ncbi:LOW QUALITY PROTEIN: hypothetical protein CRUP_027686 [Coryphaenoides rupestris]|nr:LOW QUALITY PROTEIN: hypothetical protein CRUP_027686 [Coryphaenoides rupestris]
MWPPGTVQETLGLGLAVSQAVEEERVPEKTVRMMPLGLERMRVDDKSPIAAKVMPVSPVRPAEQFNTAVFPKRVTMRSLKGFLKMGLLSMLVTSSCMTITASPPSFLAMQMNSAVSDGLTLRISSVPLRWTFILLPKYGALRKMLSGIIQVIEGVGCPSAIQSMNFLEYFTAVSLITTYCPASISFTSLISREPLTCIRYRSFEAAMTSLLGSIQRILGLGSPTASQSKRMLPPGFTLPLQGAVDQGAVGYEPRRCSGCGDPEALQSTRRMGDRIHVLDNGTLMIDMVNDKDAGDYLCVARSKMGDELQLMTVSVSMKPAKIEPKHYGKKQIPFGRDLRVDCKASGSPQPDISWGLPDGTLVNSALQSDGSSSSSSNNGGRRNRRFVLFDNGTLYLNQLIHLGGPSEGSARGCLGRMGDRIHVLDNGTLMIDMVNDKDAGDYLCVARSKMGDELQLMTVSVSMKPGERSNRNNYGKKQIPFAETSGWTARPPGPPQPDIFLGSYPTAPWSTAPLQSDGSSSSINNGGDYTCYAENQVGKDEMHVHITVVTAAPRIRPPRQTYGKVKPGGNIRFDCEAVGEPKPKILWMLPNNDVIAASNERYLMHYVCIARNPAGENRKLYRLELDGNPPVINGYRQNRTVIKDTAVKYSRKFIDCMAEGQPTPSITWIMPDNIFLKAPYFGSRINVHRNGTLEIRNVRPSDTAEFICMARNEGGEAVMVMQLEVTSMLRRPIFRNPFNERIVTRLGKTAVLNCSAGGHPAPEMIWTLPKWNALYRRAGPGIQASPWQRWDFYHLLSSDSGKYRCAAKNSVGYIEKLILLEVGQKPYILSRPRGIIRTVFGDPLFLHCLADGSPRPSVSWTVPGGHILTRPQVLGRYKLLENGTLVVHDTTIYDKGSYVCRAQNDAGEAVLTVPVLIVGYVPRLTTWPPPNVRAVAGAPVQLSCTAVGLPKPEITWQLPDGSFLSAAGPGRPLGSELLHPQGTLIIQRPTVSDSGAYKCIAKNHMGTDSKLTYVRVL